MTTTLSELFRFKVPTRKLLNTLFAAVARKDNNTTPTARPNLGRIQRADSSAGAIEAQIKQNWEWLPVLPSHHGPRHVTVLCHGLGFFDKTPEVLPRFQLHYWGSIIEALQRIGTEIIVARVPSTGTIAERARALHAQLEGVLDPGTEVNLLAHSMGGLDCRHLITHINPQTYRPVSLTTLSCPHRGSPFMDWCRDYLGLGRVIPRLSQANADSTEPATGPNRSMEDADFILKHTAIGGGSGSSSGNRAVPLSSAILTRTMLARTIDCPAYANLTTAYCNKVFNPLTPDSDAVGYYSFAASAPNSAFPLWHPLYLPHQVVSEAEGRVNDGLVSVESSKWGKFVGTVDCDHWTLRGRGLPGAANKFDVDEFYRGVGTYLYHQGY